MCGYRDTQWRRCAQSHLDVQYVAGGLANQMGLDLVEHAVEAQGAVLVHDSFLLEEKQTIILQSYNLNKL